MLDYLRQWYLRNFSDQQVVILTLATLLILAVIILFGQILTPVIAAIVLTYVLEGLVIRIESFKIPRVIAVVIVFLLFVVILSFLALGIVPLLFQQLIDLLRELPAILNSIRDRLLSVAAEYPAVVTLEQVDDIVEAIRKQLLAYGQSMVSFSVASAVDVITFMIYAVLVPLMVFFGLKDKGMILAWFRRFTPEQGALMQTVWRGVDSKIGSYIRGKFIEIGVVWSITYVVFLSMGLNYSFLLSFLVGISVIIPFVGAVVVTIPVAAIAFFQWGIAPNTGYVLLAYLIIQILDGNILVPLLFSEVVNLHPVAIIVAIVFFGGIWGLWGVFFAIPLATFIDTVIEELINKRRSAETIPPT